ncbi:MAG: DUF58 domain-containing protein [Myxococcota bacterium]|jgi:uncharacterized protein (DUF58 family)|nr:DUF58 domain-containing protein [Myxococcota bacterium]
MVAAKLFDDDFLQRLELLAVVARKVLGGVAKAERRARRIGQGIEFADHRDYHPGDDFRYIDWNIYGRLDRLLLRLFEEEEDLFIYLLPDLSTSMGAGRPPKWDYARQVAAALAYVGLSGLDRVSLVPFADRVLGRLPPTRGKGQIFKIFDFLEKLPTGGPTRLLDSLRTFVHQSKRRGLAVVISDFYDPAGVEDGLNYLRYHKFETFVIQVHDLAELEFPHQGELTLVDCETGRELPVTVTPGLVARYRQAHRRFSLGINEFCTSHAIPYYLAPVQTPFDELVLQVFRDGGFLR